ncbi:MAG: hypothetical protein ACKO69_08000 [Limnohabitans sp.]
MKTTAQWYLVEQHDLYHVYTHEQIENLPSDSYVIQKVFDTRREALSEMGRLIQLEINDVKTHLDTLTGKNLGK